MSTEIIRVPFGGVGAQVSIHRKEDGTLWMTRDEVAMALGYASGNAVRNLEDRHGDELRPFKGCLMVSTPGGVHEVVAYEERGLYLMGCLARTPVAARFRVWVANTCQGLRSGRTGLADMATLEALMSRMNAIEADLARERADRLAAVRDRFDAAQALRVARSNAAATLGAPISPRLTVLGQEDPDQGRMFLGLEEIIEDRAKARGDGRLNATESAALIGCSVRELGKRVKAGKVTRRYTGTRRPYAIDDVRAVLAPVIREAAHAASG